MPGGFSQVGVAPRGGSDCPPCPADWQPATHTHAHTCTLAQLSSRSGRRPSLPPLPASPHRPAPCPRPPLAQVVNILAKDLTITTGQVVASISQATSPTKQVTITTVAGVISLLQSLGLCS